MGSRFIVDIMKAIRLQDKALRIIDFSPLALQMGDYFHPIGNFSIVPFYGSYLASFRRFAYHITTEIQEYVTEPTLKLEDPHKHLFCILDRDFKFVKHIPCHTSTFWEDPKFNRRIPYLEDMRMVKWDGRIYGISAIFYQNENSYERFGLEVQNITVEQVGMELFSKLNCSHKWNSVQCGIMGRHKNWMPVPNKPFTFITATWKDGVQIMDIHNGEFVTIGKEGDDLYRGNAPLVKDGDGYMSIVHRLEKDAIGRKVYLNYVVEYSGDLSLKRISHPFKLSEFNIEFVTTLQPLPNGDVFIGVTEMDDHPMGMIFDRKALLSL